MKLNYTCYESALLLRNPVVTQLRPGGKCGLLCGVEVGDGGSIEEMEASEVYKYLGILENISIDHAEMKVKIKKEYKKG